MDDGDDGIHFNEASKPIQIKKRKLDVSISHIEQTRDATATGNRPVRCSLGFLTGHSRNFLHFFMDFRSIFAKIKSRNTLFCMTDKFH